MCGIAGFFSVNDRYRLLPEEKARFVDPLKYRGPDAGEQFEVDENGVYLWLAHRRLSIIDLTAVADQPMISHSKQSVIVFNGEIYNYKVLRQELLALGYPFLSHSDTEVILNGFECWGIDGLLQKLDGMFAFVLSDLRARKIYMARDRFGKKPLYYYYRNGQLIFSSDIRSFSALSSLSFTIDLHALGYYFAELATPVGRSIWSEIKKVMPASYLSVDASGDIQHKSFWQLRYTEDCPLDRDAIIEKTDALLGRAVEKRLVADVPVSALLSGGIDSSLVVAKMAEKSGRRIRTYSVGFKESNFNELQYARQVADKFNTDHTEFILDADYFMDIDSLIVEYGEPFADSSMIPTYLIAKQISRTGKVVLGGDGGDEIFAGYYSYYYAFQFDKVKNLAWAYPLASILNGVFPSYRTGLLRRLLHQARLPRHMLLNRAMGFDENGLRALFNDAVFAGSLAKEHAWVWNNYTSRSANDFINVLSASLTTRLVNDYLVKLDRSSMYASLEMRSPFLDKDLAEFAATLKPGHFFNVHGTKSILKEIAARYFSPSFIHRNKMGFQIPIGEWFRNGLSNTLKAVLLDRQSKIDLNYEYIEELVGQHVRGEADHTHRLWSLYVFHIWVQNQ